MKQLIIDKISNKHFTGYKHFFATRKSAVNCPATRGALLLELLVVISLLAIILSVGSQAMLVSMQSGKVSGERDVAMALANEGLEAVRVGV